MRELSLHILDIVENGLRAGAKLIDININEDREKNRLNIEIRDNGHGLSEEMLQKVLDPFFTTKTTRRVGLGLSLLRESCKRCDGEFNIISKEGVGTEVHASFRLDHIDLAPMGDIAGTMISLIIGNPDNDFNYTHEVNGEKFELDTRDIKKELDGLPINHPDVIRFLTKGIRDSLSDLT